MKGRTKWHTPTQCGGDKPSTEAIPFLMKDVVLPAVSFYLLKQDVARITPAA